MRPFALLVTFFWITSVPADLIPVIPVSDNGEHFVRGDSDERFVIWGVNYDHNIGKPLVVEEMFPLKCSETELATFVRQSRDVADGWISFYWGSTAQQLRKAEDATIAHAITASWLEQFQSMAEEMTKVPGE